MNGVRALYHLVRADFLERVRRYSFLGTLGFAIYLGFLCAKGDLSISLGEWRGQYNSAWLGMMMTLVATTFLSLAGFYIVSSSIKRDEKTRVGQILAATPISRVSYTWSKAISNFAVLSSMVGVLAITALVLQLFRGEDHHLDLIALFSPFVVFALPAMALVAGIAVLFEATPVLRTGAGSVIYFFAWTAGTVASEKLRSLDLLGVGVYMHELEAVVHKIDAGYKGGFILGLDFGHRQALRVFPWSGLQIPTEVLLGRLVLLMAALLMTSVAAIWFHRFDPSRTRVVERTPKKKETLSSETPTLQVLSACYLTPLDRTRAATWFAAMFIGELRLLLQRQHSAAYLVGAGLLFAGCFTPIETARRGILAAAWILPTLALSRMGARDDLFSTRALVFAAPAAVSRQLVAAWIAGASLPFVLSLGVAVRLLARGDLLGFSALITGALFVSALAMALGNLIRTPKGFEAIYVAWWYVGPLNQVPGCDFYGATAASAKPLLYATFAATLICSTWLIRHARSAVA